MVVAKNHFGDLQKLDVFSASEVLKTQDYCEETHAFTQQDIGSLVEINDFQALINPNQDEVTAQPQSGEEAQDAVSMQKKNSISPSGEDPPRYWVDANYQSSK